MSRTKTYSVLWLASWYPNKYDPYNGDFIQRHAIAVATYCQLQVIHIQFVPASWQSTFVQSEVIQQSNFSETIIYLRQSNLPSPFNKMIDQWNYTQTLKKAATVYIDQHTNTSIVHVHVPVKAGIIGLWLKRKKQLKLVVTEHWGIYNDHAPDKFVTRNYWFKNLVTQVIKQADVFLPVSKNLGNAVNQLVIEKPYQVLYNVVDTTIFYPKQSSTSSPLFWFAHVSLMNEPKNPEGLLRALTKAVKTNNLLRLRMIGNAQQSLIDFTQELGIAEHVSYTGMLPQKEVAKLLQESNAFVLFSNYENMPCSIAEASCCGLPVISTNVGGIAEIIDDSNGILVHPKDETALTKALLQLASEADRYNQTDIATTAANRFGNAQVGQQLKKIYDDLIS